MQRKPVNDRIKETKRSLASLFALALVFVLVQCLAGCCKPQVVGVTEMEGLIESHKAMNGWLRGYIEADPKLSDGDKTIRKGEIEATEEAEAKYLGLLKGEKKEEEAKPDE